MDQNTYNSYDEDRRRVAMTRSYLTPAILTMVLYLVLWLPGLIANIIYWQAASRDERLTGRSPEGKGCLLALFIVFTIVPIILICAGGALFAVVGMARTGGPVIVK